MDASTNLETEMLRTLKRTLKQQYAAQKLSQDGLNNQVNTWTQSFTRVGTAGSFISTNGLAYVPSNFYPGMVSGSMMMVSGYGPPSIKDMDRAAEPTYKSPKALLAHIDALTDSIKKLKST